jgi:hypothetical protein
MFWHAGLGPLLEVARVRGCDFIVTNFLLVKSKTHEMCHFFFYPLVTFLSYVQILSSVPYYEAPLGEGLDFTFS